MGTCWPAARCLHPDSWPGSRPPCCSRQQEPKVTLTRHSPAGRLGVQPGGGHCCHQPCPGSLPPGPVLPSARPCQGLAPEHLLPQGQRVVLAGWQGVLGSRQPLPQPLTPRHSRVWWLRVSRCRVYAGKPGSPVLRRPGGAQGTGQPSPAPLPPRPALPHPRLPCLKSLPSAAHPWPGQQSWAVHSHVPPSWLLKAQGLAPAARGVKSNLRPTPPPDTLGPSSRRPHGCKAEDAAAAPTQGSAHHLAPQACLAAVPTLPQGRISQALGKKVSRNAELRRIVQPEAVFGAKQPGSRMLQTLCSRRRTGGWGWGAGERGAAEQEAASCRPFWNSEAMDSACPGAWCVQPPAHKVLSSMGAWEGQR